MATVPRPVITRAQHRVLEALDSERWLHVTHVLERMEASATSHLQVWRERLRTLEVLGYAESCRVYAPRAHIPRGRPRIVWRRTVDGDMALRRSEPPRRFQQDRRLAS